MRPSLFPSDEELPTWLHSMLLILIVSPFAGYLFWFGVSAMTTAHLDPLSGPEFGQFFFGPSPLQGKAARVAGFSLVAFGSSFVAIALKFSRLAVPTKDVPFSVMAKGLGMPHEHLPLVEQEQRKQWNNHYGLGDLSQVFWVWAILSLACALGVLVDFL